MSGLEEIHLLVERFERADGALARTLRSGDPVAIRKAIGETVAAKRRVKRWLAQHEQLRGLDRHLAKRVRHIRDNQGYTIDRCRGLDTSDELEWEAYPDGFLTELWAAYELAEELGGNPILARAAKIGSLVLSDAVPDAIARHVATVKRAYAVGLYDAVVVFCRSLTEAAVYVFLEVRHNLPGGLKPGSFDLLERVAPYVLPEKLGNAHRVRMAANDLIHGKRKAGSTAEAVSFRVARDTFQFIEQLFG